MMLPSCVQYIQALGPTFVAVVAAGIAGYIAWRQWRTAHDKLTFDLYDRRFKVYEATRFFLFTAITQGQVNGDDYRAFLNGLRGAEFLFNKETVGRLVNIRDKAWKAQATETSWEEEG
jgi:hypothetical protein